MVCLVEACGPTVAERPVVDWTVANRASRMPLSAALKDEDVRVRRKAVWSLRDTKNADMVEPLIAALKDTDVEVRIGAAQALGKFKDARAVEPLIDRCP